MSKFSIIPNGGGDARYSGCPTFTGTYMKPGMLEFREIASPTPIDWTVGDYVVYTRTGYTYRLYGLPQVKKQARSTEYGGAFVYQSVQFFDDSKQLEICPFRDIVTDDNRIHFSTQPSISTFEAVDGIARRIQACLDDMYPGKWTVQLATADMGASTELIALMAEAREFTVSGVSLLGALDKVYEVWPEVGWTFSYDSGTGKNVLTIGGAGLSSTASYEYGKGNGLTSITRVVANADEMATRIFAYGSSRNMLPRWYNNQDIKDAESVDIQNLMIPVSQWGETEVGGVMLPDAAKAYLDASPAIMARLGLRPKTYYFDGTGDLPEIYPSIREMTIGMIRTAKGNDPAAPYYPKTNIYTDANARVDTILSAPASFDSGMAGDGNGKETTYDEYSDASGSDSVTIPAGMRRYVNTIISKSFAFSATDAGIRDISFSIDLGGTVNLTGIESATVTSYLCKGHPSNAPMMSREFRLEPSSTTAGVYNFAPFTFSGSRKNIEAATYYLLVDLDLEFEAGSSARTLTYSFVGGITANLSNYRDTTFKINIRQVGFDINAQAALGEGKTIAMRSGKCAGRAFTIKTCTYVESTDSWLLEVIRSQDDSLSQWFPNTDYPIVAGDEFVLLDIAMPDEYILVAEQRLLAAAQELLADVSVERWQYTPEIDAKFMVENSRTIYPAQNMILEDDDIVDDSPVSILIDTVTINEGEAAIPTYKVTLRDRKKKSYTDSKGADSISSNPVTKVSNTATSASSSVVGESYFTLDENGNVTLKAKYQNFWVPGSSSAGGVGSNNGGGGGGGATYLNDLQDVTAPNPSNGDLLLYNGSAWINTPSSSFASLSNGANYSTITINGTTANFYTKAQVDGLLSGIHSFEPVAADSLPTASADTMFKLYLVPSSDPETGNVKEEYITVRSGSSPNYTYEWELVGSTAVDLSGYLPLTGGTMTGAITMNGANILPATDSTCSLGTSNKRFENGYIRNIYTTYLEFRDSTGQTFVGRLGFGTDNGHNYGTIYVPYGNSSSNYSFWDEYGFFHSGNGDVPCGRSDHRWETLYAVDANLSGVVIVNGINSIDQSDSGMSLYNYGGRASKSFNAYGSSINFRACDSDGTTQNIFAVNQTVTLVGKTLRPNYNSSNVNLGAGSNDGGRWATIYGIDGDLSGNLKLSASSYIDLGPIRLEYDSTRDLLHVTTNDSTNHPTIGLWVDGSSSAGGVGSNGGSGSVIFLNDLSDVTVPSPSDGDLLAWDSTADEWVNIPQSSVVPSLSGYVPTSRTVNGHALSSDVTVTKGDIGLGNVENTKLSTWSGSANITTLGTITSGTWNGSPIANAKLANSSISIAGANVSLGGSISAESLKSNLGINTIESEIAKFNSWFSEDSNGNLLVNPNNGVPRGFYTAGFLSGGGVGTSGSGSGGGGNEVAWGTSTQDSVQLTVDSVTFNLSKAGVTDHFTGYIGSTNSNQSVALSSLEEYTDQSGKVSLTLGSASYLWVCLDRNEFTVESEGIEIPMQFVSTQSNVNCYVSAEKLNAGVVSFVVKYDKIAKPDSERLVITARSYTITYGDALPDFSYTANGQVEGTPQITCAATASSGVGTYAIVITRGTVTDANAIYENGTLTIEKANLTITADDKFVELNGTMPTFTVSYSGFVHDETPSVLTQLPSCTTNAQGTSTAGQYNIVPSGATAANYSFTYVNGRLYVGVQSLVSWTSAQMFDGKSIGGFIDTSAYQKKTSTTYWGIVIDVDGYQGCTMKFTRASGVNFFRFAFMKSCANWTNNSAVDYSSATGYTSMVQVNAETAEAVIPADTKYVYVYTYSNGTNYAPSVEIEGTPIATTRFNLVKSLFVANKAVNATTGTLVNASTSFCTSTQLKVSAVTANYLLSAILNNMPSIYDTMYINVASYTTVQTFIKRYDYTALPDSFTFGPDESYIHIMFYGKKNGVNVDISAIPIDNDDVQLIINDI